MQEEYHGIDHGSSYTFKQLYGWGTLTTNIWLPSLSELVGTTGEPADYNDCYYSAMQGLNVSVKYWTDPQGGFQWKLFEAYNTSGGGQMLWKHCQQQQTWLRSPHSGSEANVWSIKDESSMNPSANPPTLSHAVHPARRNKFRIVQNGFHYHPNL